MALRCLCETAAGGLYRAERKLKHCFWCSHLYALGELVEGLGYTGLTVNSVSTASSERGNAEVTKPGRRRRPPPYLYSSSLASKSPRTTPVPVAAGGTEPPGGLRTCSEDELAGGGGAATARPPCPAPVPAAPARLPVPEPPPYPEQAPAPPGPAAAARRHFVRAEASAWRRLRQGNRLPPRGGGSACVLCSAVGPRDGRSRGLLSSPPRTVALAKSPGAAGCGGQGQGQTRFSPCCQAVGY